MYTLNFKNNYFKTVMFDINEVPPGGSTIDRRTSGNATVRADGLSTMLILDLGETKIPGYELEGALGILFRYETVEVYSRYDKDGVFDITLDELGDMHIKTINGNSILIKLPGLTLEK